MSLKHPWQSIEEYYGANPEALAISTCGEFWRGGGVTVMDTKEYNYQLYQNLFTCDNLTPKNHLIPK
jgi:hypothetical protein